MSPYLHSDAVGMVIDGRYRLVDRIGVDLMASVYLADDVRLRRRVAVKLFSESLADESGFSERFASALQSASSLRHPHIVVIHDWGVDDQIFTASEFLVNGSLRRLLDQGKVLSPAQVLQVGLAAARALAYAHERRVVHGAVRPANLLFAADGRLRITDFGLARVYAEVASTEPMGGGGSGARYAAPEQVKGLDIDGKADVYALALTMVEAATGSTPFAADTALATLMGRVDRPLEVPEILGPLQDPLERAGTIDPSERLDASGLATALMAVASELPSPEAISFGVPRDVYSSSVSDEESRDITLVVSPVEADSIVATISDRPVGASDVDEGNDESEAEGEAEPSTRSVAVASVADHREDPDGNVVGDAGIGEERRRHNQRRWRAAWMVFAIVFVAGGVIVGGLVWRAHRTPSHPVPSVAGLSVTAATSRLELAGFAVSRRFVRRDGTKRGELLGIEPEAGTRLAEGHTVTLVVSAGQTLVSIPDDLAGLTAAQADARLVKLGLDPREPESTYSETVDDGVVIGLAEGTPSRIEKGATVRLVISRGPTPRVVPSVAGMTPQDAEAALTRLGLVPAVERRLDAKVDTGGLVGLDPGPGTTVPRGSTVTVVISKGLLVAVPSLDGISSVAGAINRLQQAGLVPGTVQGSGQLSGKPVAFDPPAGQLVAKGSTVNIVVR